MIGMVGSAVCYVAVSVLSNAVLSLVACASVGVFTAMLWPGTLILMEEKVKGVGVAAYALMAAGGDFGASVAPQLLGIVVDKISVAGWAQTAGSSLSISSEQLGLKIGMLLAAIFPVLGALLLVYMKKHFKNFN